MGMKKKNSYFSEQQLIKLDLLAEETGITVAEHLRRAVDYYLEIILKSKQGDVK